MKWPSPRKSEKDGRLMSFSTDYVGPFFLPPSLLEFPFWLSVPSIVHPTAAAGAGLWVFFQKRILSRSSNAAGTRALGAIHMNQELAGGVEIVLRCLRFQSSPASLAARRASTTTSQLTLNGSL
jgi:hypothetical protein